MLPGGAASLGLCWVSSGALCRARVCGVRAFLGALVESLLVRFLVWVVHGKPWRCCVPGFVVALLGLWP